MMPQAEHVGRTPVPGSSGGGQQREVGAKRAAQDLQGPGLSAARELSILRQKLQGEEGGCAWVCSLDCHLPYL